MTSSLRFLFPAVLILVCASTLAAAATGKPILVSEPNSTRAIALEATSLTREPFNVQSTSFLYGIDRTTRIMLFAVNLSLQAPNEAAMMTADAEDAAHVHYALRVEYAGKAPGLDWLTVVVVRLDETMTDLGDVLIQTTYRGVPGNRVRVGIGHVGGGPPDDPGAGPTPAPPYALTGKVLSTGAGLDGVMLSLSGSASMNAISDANGAFSFLLPSVGDYSITASKRFFTLSPATIVLNNLTNSSVVNFSATRDTVQISGVVKDAQGQAMNDVSVKLETTASGVPSQTVNTANGGLFTFPSVLAGYNYTITPANTNLYSFTAQTVTEVDKNLTLDFNGTLRTYSINGFVGNLLEHAVADVEVTLSGAATASTRTDTRGKFVFSELPAGRNYTITGTKRFFTVTPANIQVTNLINPADISFTAVRNTWSITGVVKSDEGQPLAGTSVILQDSGGSTLSVKTDDTGAFAFNGVTAGDNYTIRPATTSVFTFATQTINELNQNETFNFDGVRRTYTISGLISDKAQQGVSGVTVQLTGAATATTTTDAGGKYAFANLFAGRDYSVTAHKTDHFVNPISPSFTLLRDEPIDFSAIRFYRITGRVTDQSRGLYGINLSLTGPEVSSVRTANDGSYSLIVTTTGNYSLTPSREQNFYQFSPSQQNLNVADHMTVDFGATLVITGPSYVLEFDGTPTTADYGYLWPADINIGNFFWEFWAMPGADTYTRYLISDGYGGAHSILFGFNYGLAGHYNLFGNIWNGAPNFYFDSDDGPAPGEWGHYAVGWDGQNVITYYNGVPVGKQAFTGPRSSTSYVNGSNLALIGGSDHQNLRGRIAQVRGYEESNPRASAPESSFRPQTVFAVDGQFLTYFFHPDTVLPDFSLGYRGLQHDGRLHPVQNGYILPCNGCPTPQFVIDPTAPNFANPTNPGTTQTLVDTPSAPPSGARVFDSFSRNNSTYILNGQGGLGVVETGAQTWSTNVAASQPQPFGILGSKAVVLANETALAWVSVSGSPNMDVRVDRTNGRFGSGHNTGVCFRVVNKDNFFFAYTGNDDLDPSAPNKLSVGYFQAGVRVVLAADITLPSDWMTLRVVTRSTGLIEIYAGEVQVYSTNNSQSVGAMGAGLFSYGSGMSLQNRWDNFTVLPAP